jgi:hypothetical protein
VEAATEAAEAAVVGAMPRSKNGHKREIGKTLVARAVLA